MTAYSRDCLRLLPQVRTDHDTPQRPRRPRASRALSMRLLAASPGRFSRVRRVRQLVCRACGPGWGRRENAGAASRRAMATAVCSACSYRPSCSGRASPRPASASRPVRSGGTAPGRHHLDRPVWPAADRPARRCCARCPQTRSGEHRQRPVARAGPPAQIAPGSAASTHRRIWPSWPLFAGGDGLLQLLQRGCIERAVHRARRPVARWRSVRRGVGHEVFLCLRSPAARGAAPTEAAAAARREAAARGKNRRCPSSRRRCCPHRSRRRSCRRRGHPSPG